MYPYLLVAIGGAIGSVLRYGAGVAVGSVFRNPFPLGTLLINIIGSLVMGLFVGLMARTLPAWQNDARLFFAVGVLGGFTTFSAFSLETALLYERGEMLAAGLYMIASAVLAVAGLFAGLYVIRSIVVS